MSSSEPPEFPKLSHVLPDNARHDLLRRGTRKGYRRGERMLTQGEQGLHVLVLVDGWVRVVRTERDGAQITLATRSALDIVGEASVLDERPRSASVWAGSDCDVRVVGAADFLDFIHGTGVMRGVVRLILARLQQADDLSAEMASLPVRQRVARMLLRLTGAGGLPDRARPAAGGDRPCGRRVPEHGRHGARPAARGRRHPHRAAPDPHRRPRGPAFPRPLTEPGERVPRAPIPGQTSARPPGDAEPAEPPTPTRRYP